MFEPISSLDQAVQKNGLDILTIKINTILPASFEKPPRIEDRYCIHLYDDNECSGEWVISSLRELFRGKRQPPQNVDHDSEEYGAIFYKIEWSILKANISLKNIRDEEVARLFHLMRKSPDSRSEGFLHDVIYQSAALLLGLVPLSRKEFEAILKHLEKTVRGWQMNSSSQNYIRYLRRDLLGEIYKTATDS